MLWLRHGVSCAVKRCQSVRFIVSVCAVGLVCSGCGDLSFRELVGYPKQNDPSVAIRPTETRWLLIKNPRFGDVPSEPEYVWVEEDKIPFTMKGLIFGKKSLIAPPSVVSKYGSPPGGGRISPSQGGAYQVENYEPGRASSNGSVAVPVSTSARTDGAGAPASHRGYVVFVDTTRVVVDLTAKDGVRAGSVVSVRRDKIPIVHPVTGEFLGELDEEVATGKISEVHDKFSVVEVDSVAAGAQVKVKDRVVVR